MEASQLDYPFNVFPTDILRRVCATLPTYQTDEAIAEINAYHEELWKDEPVPAPTHRKWMSVPDLTAKLAEDEHSFTIDVDGARDYSDEEIAEALSWLLESGYVEFNEGSNSYTQTAAGLAALSE